MIGTHTQLFQWNNSARNNSPVQNKVWSPSKCKCFQVTEVSYSWVLWLQNFFTSNHLQYMISTCIRNYFPVEVQLYSQHCQNLHNQLVKLVRKRLTCCISWSLHLHIIIIWPWHNFKFIATLLNTLQYVTNVIITISYSSQLLVKNIGSFIKINTETCPKKEGNSVQ